MSKRKEGACEESAPSTKKMQQTAMSFDDTEGDIFQSSYSLKEMFHRVPIHLVEELLDCFDILHTARLYRYLRVLSIV